MRKLPKKLNNYYIPIVNACQSVPCQKDTNDTIPHLLVFLTFDDACPYGSDGNITLYHRKPTHQGVNNTYHRAYADAEHPPLTREAESLQKLMVGKSKLARTARVQQQQQQQQLRKLE